VISLLVHAAIGILLAATTFTVHLSAVPASGPREFAVTVEVRSAPTELNAKSNPAPSPPIVEPETADVPPVASIEFINNLPALPDPEATERVLVLPLSINAGVPVLRSIIRGGSSASSTGADSANAAPPSEQPQQPAALYKAPEYASNPPPSYPPLAQRMGWQGVVVLHVRIGPDGSCLGAEVSRSSGHGVLDDAARKAVQSWQFKPATRDGVPVEGEADIPIRFALID